jgi:hypothetical protein
MPQSVKPTGYSHADAWDAGWLKVDSIHEVYYEQYGKQDGKSGKAKMKPTETHTEIPY